VFPLSFRLWQKFCRVGAQHPMPHPVTNEVRAHRRKLLSRYA